VFALLRCVSIAARSSFASNPTHKPTQNKQQQH
jgi:hypothetical protein